MSEIVETANGRMLPAKAAEIRSAAMAAGLGGTARTRVSRPSGESVEVKRAALRRALDEKAGAPRQTRSTPATAVPARAISPETRQNIDRACRIVRVTGGNR